MGFLAVPLATDVSLGPSTGAHAPGMHGWYNMTESLPLQHAPLSTRRFGSVGYIETGSPCPYAHLEILPKLQRQPRTLKSLGVDVLVCGPCCLLFRKNGYHPVPPNSPARINLRPGLGSLSEHDKRRCRDRFILVQTFSLPAIQGCFRLCGRALVRSCAPALLRLCACASLAQ